MFDWFRNTSSQKQSPEKVLTLKDQVRQQYDAYYIGKITHFYARMGVAILVVEKGEITLGDTIYIQGANTRFKQHVTSIEYQHRKVRRVGPGYEVGIQLSVRARIGDDVYRL
ncbi:MAG: hypothetical protein A2Z91_09080 [Deltaproteobacteria bacterium GWA2_38_16]|nr:MAG: hypothetical protein A2Z91_09080 [Deltaproteobacteria bacterium GWA2_38_16]OGQ02549.1 MAG: hypothetical protein A3D19_09650 [Deltaproteobacteria bacterium RIFCSPHIGHO2_02_FULL_38_15]OGQ30585.1 MAG: hypothetical protein A3A72_08120 [Deltaproteobacteria bacterium RIFCSPLOWO2_01_FULL_38_9]OGQ60377.1 MAG: hypothetical protein A3G92_03300 [Deltaproteobacteria bacterium RIFCSPLOWO2_12_FULL_38_8]HBQ20996.1 hypothetical protein [Deltaproteobacteria bacterium]